VAYYVAVWGAGLSFAPYATELTNFSSQIRMHQTDVRSFAGGPWDRDHGLRNCLLSCVNTEKPNPDDLLLQLDLDEIPMPSVLREMFFIPPNILFVSVHISSIIHIIGNTAVNGFATLLFGEIPLCILSTIIDF
jgi:hypothetical protein